jgi:hypothetical protein
MRPACPDEEQLTTARDQATLGRAIQDRFPKYYRYFATPSFTYRGHAMRNHNKLLGRVEGVDGIKTGYTRASGFNLVSSVRPRQPPHRGGRDRWLVRRRARCAHARPDRAAHRERLDAAARSRRSPSRRTASAPSPPPGRETPEPRSSARR